MNKKYFFGRAIMIGLITLSIPIIGYGQLNSTSPNTEQYIASIKAQTDAMHTALSIPNDKLIIYNTISGFMVATNCSVYITQWINNLASGIANPHKTKYEYEVCLNEVIGTHGQTQTDGTPLQCNEAEQYVPRNPPNSNQIACCIKGTIQNDTNQSKEINGKTYPVGVCLAFSSQDACLAIDNELMRIEKEASTLACSLTKSIIDNVQLWSSDKTKFSDEGSGVVLSGATFASNYLTALMQSLTQLSQVEGFANCQQTTSKKTSIETLINGANPLRTSIQAGQHTDASSSHATLCSNVIGGFTLDHKQCEVKSDDQPTHITTLYNAVTDVRTGLTPASFVIGEPLWIINPAITTPLHTRFAGSWQSRYNDAQQTVINTSQFTQTPITSASDIIAEFEKQIKNYHNNLVRFQNTGIPLYHAYCEAGINFDIQGSDGSARAGGTCADTMAQYFIASSSVEDTLKEREEIKKSILNTVNATILPDGTTISLNTCDPEQLNQYPRNNETEGILNDLTAKLAQCQHYEQLITIATNKQTEVLTSLTEDQKDEPTTTQRILYETEQAMIERCEQQQCVEITPKGMCCTQGQRGANDGLCYPSDLIALDGTACPAGITDEGTCVANNRGDMGIQCTPQQLLIGACTLRIYDTLQIRASNKDPNPKVFIQDIILSATSFIGVVATLALMVSGFQAIMAGYNNGSEYQTAIRNAGYAVLGLLIAAFSYAIIRGVQYIAMAGG